MGPDLSKRRLSLWLHKMGFLHRRFLNSFYFKYISKIVHYSKFKVTNIGAISHRTLRFGPQMCADHLLLHRSLVDSGDYLERAVTVKKGPQIFVIKFLMIGHHAITAFLIDQAHVVNPGFTYVHIDM